VSPDREAETGGGGERGGRHLVVFDVDGTLTRTTGIDDRCYTQDVARFLEALALPD
jgi:hypothetical protein